jgi:hypothetical protein
MVRRAVMPGAGHAHLFTLKRTADFVRRGFELVLVAPKNFWYSGLATNAGFSLSAIDPFASLTVSAGASISNQKTHAIILVIEARRRGRCCLCLLQLDGGRR